ncbi:MAG: hypothetical protein WBA57_26485 [Elainellaceae cyanobacterium]
MAIITGAFFSQLPSSIGFSGLAIAVFYAEMVCRFQKRAIWVATGVAALLAIVYSSQDSMLYGYIVGMTLAINAWIFGTLGIKLLSMMNHQQTLMRLAGLLAGSLGSGWAIAAFSE